MATYNEAGLHNLVTSASLSAGTRVTMDISTGYVSAAGADQKSIGSIRADVASGDVAMVQGLPSRLVKAALAITLGSELYPAGSGKVTGISTSLLLLGFANKASAAANDNIELIPIVPANYIA